jgi:hypothetical protein
MHLPIISRNMANFAGDPRAVSITSSEAANDGGETSYCNAGQPGIAFAGLLLGATVAITAMMTVALPESLRFAAALVGLGLLLVTFWVVAARGRVQPICINRALSGQVVSDWTPPETAEIWLRYPSCFETEEPHRIALISTDRVQSRTIAISLTGLGPVVHHCTDRDAMFDSVQARPQDWDLVIYDLDCAPDPETGMNDLQDFHEECPDLPVVLLSGSAQRDGPSHDCRLSGDITSDSSPLPAYLIECLKSANLNIVQHPR